MLKLTQTHALYLSGMAFLFASLDFIGVPNGDKFALAVIGGAVAPLFFPKITAKLLRFR